MTSFEDRPRWPNKKIIPKKNKKTKSEGIDYPKLKLKRMFLKLKKKDLKLHIERARVHIISKQPTVKHILEKCWSLKRFIEKENR